MASYGELWGARWALMRPGNAVMAAAAVLTGMVLAGQGSISVATWVGAPIAAFLVTAFGNVINDLGDLETDRRAHPERPLPSGRISPRDAGGFAALLLGLGLWEAFVAGGWPLGLFAVLNAAALGVYEWQLKARGLLGNLLVGALVGSAFVFGATAASGFPELGIVWLLAGLAGATTVARELLKDLEDVASDAGSRRTFPMQAGRPATLLVSSALVGAAVAASVGAVDLAPNWWPKWWILLAAANAVMLAGVGIAWKDPARGQQVLKAGMAGAVLAFLAGPLMADALAL